MAPTFASSALKRPQQSLPDPSGSTAKASLRETEVIGTVLREVAADALRRVGSSQKAAAITLAISEGRLSSKLKDGSLTLKHLEQFGPGYVEEFARALVERTESNDPRARLRQLFRDLHARLDEVEDEVTR